MGELSLMQVVLAVIIGTLAAIVYSLRVLILLERRVAGMEANIQRIAMRILREEKSIQKSVTRKKSSAKKSSRKRR